MIPASVYPDGGAETVALCLARSNCTHQKRTINLQRNRPRVPVSQNIGTLGVLYTSYII